MRRPWRTSAVSRYSFAIAYDQELADRIRELLVTESWVTESRMFGGLAFLVGGHMAIAASGQGGALVRIDSHDLQTRDQLAKWVDLGIGFARSLPPKRAKQN